MVRMRYVVGAIILTVVLLLVITSGCHNDFAVFEKFFASDPAIAFNQDDIDYLVQNFHFPLLSAEEHTDTEIADAIVNWQDQYMVLGLNVPDLSYPMRWNQVIPGVYSARDLIRDRHHSEESTNKIYGVCWDFATVFTAIAQYYELTVRITAWQVYLSDHEELQVDYEVENQQEGPDQGMSPTELQALIERLHILDYDIPEHVLQNAIFETYVHYRPEVYIDDTWYSYDATNPNDTYKNAEYGEISWDMFLDEDICIKP